MKTQPTFVPEHLYLHAPAPVEDTARNQDRAAVIGAIVHPVEVQEPETHITLSFI